MKTLFFTLTLSLLGQHAWAMDKEDVNQAVLRSLVAHSAEITLLSEGDGRPLSAEWQLPSLIAAYLSHGYASHTEKDSLVLGDVIVDCQPMSQEGRYRCGVTFLDGDFSISNNGSRFEGPGDESSVSFQVPVEKDAKGRVRLLARQFKAMMAG